MKSVDTLRNAKGEGSSLERSDTHGRKLGERNGLDTRVVLAVNDGY